MMDSEQIKDYIEEHGFDELKTADVKIASFISPFEPERRYYVAMALYPNGTLLSSMAYSEERSALGDLADYAYNIL